MVDAAAINALARKIAEEFHPERIILFGSHAYGSPHHDSDVDLLIVLPFSGPPYLTAGRIRAVLTRDIPLDIIVRSPSEVVRLYSLGDPVIRTALDSGRELYKAAA